MRTEQARPVRLEDYRAAGLAGRDGRPRRVAASDRRARARDARAAAQSGGAAPAPLVLDGDGLDARRRSSSTARRLPPSAYVATPDSLTIAQPPPAVPARDRDAGRPDRQHPADGPLPLERHLLHPVRGRRLPPHHLFPRPARRDGGLHDAHRGREERSAGAARQRQSRRRRRRAGTDAPFRGLARSVPEALLSVRAGRRRSRLRRGQFRHACRAARSTLRIYVEPGKEDRCRLRDGLAQALDALGRGGVRPRIRPRHLHDRRRVRLQHGRDGEQGPQHLQRQATCWPSPRPRPTPTTPRSRPSSRTSISTTGPATASPAATGSSSA